LNQITDPVALMHESGQYAGRPDLDNVNANVRAGASCIVQRAAALKANAVVTSGFRPPAYQSHLREVWDKWQLLKNNSSPECATIKAEVRTHWVQHAIVRQPGTTSNHSSGNAVDIAGVPSSDADSIAEGCNMRRPLSDDPVHYEPR
jgi:D-alanyl-D-alanine dipeptidase